jgi:hypothetical protein
MARPAIISLAKIIAGLLAVAAVRAGLSYLSAVVATVTASAIVFGYFLVMARSRLVSIDLKDLLALIAAAVISTVVVLPKNARDFAFSSSVVFLLGLPVVLHIGWGCQRAVKTYRAHELPDRQRLELALSEIIPQKLARVAAAELNIISNAFRWNSPPDVPAGARGFSYYKLVAPMMWAFLFLATIETLILHLLLSMWNPTVAWVVFIISDISVLYLLGLIVSLRRLPVTIDDNQVRIRAGILYDFSIPLASITNVTIYFPSTDVKRPGMLKTSLMAFPNVILEFTPSIPAPRPMGVGDPISRVAMALDDRTAFVEAIRMHLIKDSSL